MKQYFLLLAFCLTGINSIAQDIQSIYKAGGIHQDFLKSFHIDHQKNYYGHMEGYGSTLYFAQDTVQPPTSINSSTTYTTIFKADSIGVLQWVKFHPSKTPGQNSSNINDKRNFITTDANLNVYVSFVNIDSTTKYNAQGVEQWKKPFSGQSIEFTSNGNLDLYNYSSFNDSVNNVPIFNKKGTVVSIDTNGNYVSHTTAMNNSWATVEIEGRYKNGFYGYRRKYNSGTSRRTEIIIYDSSGAIIDTALINYSQYSDMDIIYDDVHHVFYAEGRMIDRNPPFVNNNAYGPSANVIIQYDTLLNPTRHLKLGKNYNSSSPYGKLNLIELNLTACNGDVYFTGTTASKVNIPFAGSNPVYLAKKYNLFYGKLDQTLNLKWIATLEDESYSNQIGKIKSINDELFIYGQVDKIIKPGINFYSLGGTDIFIGQIEDNDSINGAIEGTVFIDANQNQVSDSENPKSFIPIATDHSSVITYSNQGGKYKVPAVEGSNTIRLVQKPLYWTNSTPDSLTLTTTKANPNADSVDFGIHPIAGIQDFRVELTPITENRAGFRTQYQVLLENLSPIAQNVTLSLFQDTLLQFLYAADTPSTNIGNVLTWNYTSLNPGEIKIIDVIDSISSLTPFDLYAVSALYTDKIAQDTTPYNNGDTTANKILSSYDPNDKLVDPECMTFQQYINDIPLTYKVRFQNTGNASAINIMIKDTLPQEADLSTFEVLAYSHPVQVYRDGHILTFQFENINLPHKNADDLGSNGFVKYRIKKNASTNFSISPGNASIYFDFNAPIVTGNALTRVQSFIDTVSHGGSNGYCPTSQYTLPGTGRKVNQTGVYLDTLQSFIGCDSLIYRNIKFTPFRTGIINAIGCNYYLSPLSVLLTQSGTYIDTLYCDSILIINLTINQIKYNNDTIYGCHSVTLDSIVYSNNTMISITYSGQFCDSIVSHYIVLNNNYSNETISQCGTYSSPSGKYIWNTSGLYTDTVINQSGCDSILNINLSILPLDSVVDKIQSCKPISWIDGFTYTTNNSTATHLLTNNFGCDSLVQLDFTRIVVDSSVTNSSPTFIANAVNATFQWLDCNNAFAAIPGETTSQFTATQNGDYAVEITQYGCIDTSVCYTVQNIGLSELYSDQRISISPNPNKGSFTIHFGEVRVNEFNIINSLGQQVYLGGPSSGDINLDLNLTAGTYYIVFDDGLKHKSQKISIVN